jgi:hypothetical protein
VDDGPVNELSLNLLSWRQLCYEEPTRPMAGVVQRCRRPFKVFTACQSDKSVAQIFALKDDPGCG